MIGELWQFLAAGTVGILAIILWIFVVYLPRRKWDGDGNDDTPDKSSSDKNRQR